MRPEAEDKYQDMDGNPISLYKLVRECPDWAINRIRAGEKAIAELSTLLSKVKGEWVGGKWWCPDCEKFVDVEIKHEAYVRIYCKECQDFITEVSPPQADTDCPDPCTEMTVKGCEDCADTEQACPACKGKGFHKFNLVRAGESHEKTCTRCNGTGKADQTEGEKYENRSD
ncbi:MAG TPA: hypothetical protein VMV86_02345 [Methanosarcinales archaeon]|nr:hypothetical protein [Methanosarcinales archaeon]